MRIASWAAGLIAIIGFAGSVQQAEAANLFQRTFVQAHGAPSCYMRTYSNAFLKKHPKLSVRLMALALSPTGLADGVKNSAGNFALRLSIELKKSPVNSTLGFCKTKGSGFSCNLESDGGSIRITRVGRDLRITSNRIEIEGNGFGDNDLSLTAPAGQTRSFLLKRATTTQCDEAFD